MDQLWIFWTLLFVYLPTFAVSFDWEYAALYSFDDSTYSLKVFQNETSETYLHFLAILTDEGDEHGFEEAEETAELWEESEILVSHGNQISLHQNLLFAFEIEEDSPVSIFNFDFHEPIIFTFFFEHDIEEFPYQLVDSSGVPVLPLVEESGDEHEHTSTSLEETDDDHVVITSKTWGTAIAASIVTSILSITGLFIFFALKKASVKTTILNISHAFGSGALLAASFLHLVPEAFVFLEDYGDIEEIGWKTGIVVLAGLLCSLIIHTIFSTHEHEVAPNEEGAVMHGNHVSTPECVDMSGGDKDDEVLQSQSRQRLSITSTSQKTLKKMKKIKPECWNIFLGDLIHNFLDGVLIAAAFSGCGQNTGWSILAAVASHEIPQEIADYFILLKSGMSAFQATLFNLLSGLSSILGAIVLLSASSSMTKEHLGYMLLWGSGIFIFIGATELLPEVLKVKGTDQDSMKMLSVRLFAFILGAIIVSLPLLSHSHCDSGALAHVHSDHSDSESTESDHDDHDH